MGTSTVSKNRRTKAAKSALAVGLALALALGGTFAWTSFSQRAKNEMTTSVNPGGRLHDDFNWKANEPKDKNVYVENFTDPDGDGQSIYARVKLVEYLEVGDKAGTDAFSAAGKKYPSGADATDETTWATHMLGDTHKKGDAALGVDEDIFHKHFKLTFGGQTTYMPTFNKNKDSLTPDVRGALGDTGGPYTNYRKFNKDETESGTEYYDADTNVVDEGLAGEVAPGAGGTEDTNYTKKEAEHKAQDTLSAEVISMEQWNNAPYNAEPGPYWVYDADGWAYWAQAITPGTATGLLLSNVEQLGRMGSDWYYAVEAVGEFVTGDEIKEDRTDAANPEWIFGSRPADGAQETAERKMSESAYNLLQKAVEKAPFDEQRAIIKRASTAMDAAGSDGTGDVSKSIVVLEGTEYVKLAQDNDNNTLLMTYNLLPDDVAFGPDNSWANSTLRTWLNEDYYNSLPVNTKSRIVPKAIYTKKNYSSDEFDLIEDDHAFILSEADVFGTDQGVSENVDPQCFTYESQLVPGSLRDGRKVGSESAHDWCMRSPRGNKGYYCVGYVHNGENGTGVMNNLLPTGVRPAFWINLES